MFKMLTYFVCIVLFWSCARGSEPGTPCETNGVVGRCVPVSDCLTAKENNNKNDSLAICWYETEEYICCPMYTTPSTRATSKRSTDDCEPLTSVTAPEVGRKSWNKCLEYQEKIMRPCKDIPLGEGKFRESKCKRDTLALFIEHGVLENEYPHIVLQGYGDDINSAVWLTEGVIISERYILTIASRTYHPHYGPVKFIRTAVVNTSASVDPSRLFKIKRIIKHPSYKAPKPYYNIALLELENDIPLDLSALPACIDTGNLPNYTHAVVLGWDASNRDRTMLQRKHLLEDSSTTCVQPGDRRPYDKTIQTCYKMYDNTFENGFENILQIEHIKCMYVVTGLGTRRFREYTGNPFTRVSTFVPWIESIVWP